MNSNKICPLTHNILIIDSHDNQRQLSSLKSDSLCRPLTLVQSLCLRWEIYWGGQSGHPLPTFISNMEIYYDKIICALRNNFILNNIYYFTQTDSGLKKKKIRGKTQTPFSNPLYHWFPEMLFVPSLQKHYEALSQVFIDIGESLSLFLSLISSTYNFRKTEYLKTDPSCMTNTENVWDERSIKLCPLQSQLREGDNHMSDN